MFKSTKRAQRRHHYQRLKERRVKRKYWCFHSDSQLSKRHLGVAVNTPKICSCWMCGNPRKQPGDSRTRSEKKADLALKEFFD